LDHEAISRPKLSASGPPHRRQHLFEEGRHHPTERRRPYIPICSHTNDNRSNRPPFSGTGDTQNPSRIKARNSSKNDATCTSEAHLPCPDPLNPLFSR
jgi:hypothetical protein